MVVLRPPQVTLQVEPPVELLTLQTAVTAGPVHVTCEEFGVDVQT